MSYIHFNFLGQNPIVAQPQSNSLVAFSSSASDTTQTLYAAGELSSTNESDSIALNGTLEVQGSQAFDKINFLTLSDACVGQVTVQESGTAANGHIFPVSVPPDGTVMEIGLSGNTQSYDLVAPSRTIIGVPSGSNLNTSGTGSFVVITDDVSVKLYWFDNGVTTAPGAYPNEYAVSFSGERAEFTLQCPAGSTIPDTSYFTLEAVTFWYEVDSSGSPSPVPGATKISISSSDSASAVAAATLVQINASSLASSINFTVSGDTITGIYQGAFAITVSFSDSGTGITFTQTNPGVNESSATANAAALQASIAVNSPAVVSSVNAADVTVTYIKLGYYQISQNATQFGLTVVSPGTVIAANQIRTGFTDDGSPATTSDIAQYITWAINDTASGSNVFVSDSTVANQFVTAALVSGTVSVVDKVECVRNLAWVFTSSDPSLTMIPPAGGANGNIVAIISFGTTNAFDVISLNSEGLNFLTLPPQFTGTSVPYILNGNFSTLYLKCDPVPMGQTLAAYYQTSNDGINWSDGIASIPNLDDNTVLDPIIQYIEEGVVNQIRLIISQNTLNAPVSVCATLSF